jgi:hypothetical protein
VTLLGVFPSSPALYYSILAYFFLSLVFCDMGINLADATQCYPMFHLLPLEFEVPLHM